MTQRTAKGRVDIKIEGWGGTRKIPVKQLRNFAKDVLTIPQAGFDSFGQKVQLDDKYLAKLKAVVEKHGLRLGPQEKARSYWGPKDTKVAVIAVRYAVEQQRREAAAKKPVEFTRVVLMKNKEGKVLKKPLLQKFVKEVQQAIPEATWQAASDALVIPKKSRKKLTPILTKYWVNIQYERFDHNE